tara:strand:+ start:204 stop:392 length:189 start_codon:yes stop_codon:yes gene_type:complete
LENADPVTVERILILFKLLRKTPITPVISGEWDVGYLGSDHFYRDSISPENLIVKFPWGHFS